MYFLSISLPIINRIKTFFTGTLCGQFAIMWLLYIQPHRKCVFTLPCEIWIKYACITIITNKHFGKIEKKHFKSKSRWMICITPDCVGLTQFSIIRIIHRNVGLKSFIKLFYLLKCLLLSLGFLTFMFHKVVKRRIYDVMEYYNVSLHYLVKYK